MVVARPCNVDKFCWIVQNLVAQNQHKSLLPDRLLVWVLLKLDLTKDVYFGPPRSGFQYEIDWSTANQTSLICRDHILEASPLEEVLGHLLGHRKDILQALLSFAGLDKIALYLPVQDAELNQRQSENICPCPSANIDVEMTTQNDTTSGCGHVCFNKHWSLTGNR